MAEQKLIEMPAFQQARKRLKSGGADVKVNVEAVRADMRDRSNANFAEVTWPKGVSFIVPDKVQLESECLFASKINGNTAYGVTVMCNDKIARNLYFGSLRKSVVPYKAAEGGFAVDYSKETIESNTKFHAEVVNCANQEEILNLLESKAGKTISVVDVQSCDTARMRFENGDGGRTAYPIGLRRGTVAFFECN